MLQNIRDGIAKILVYLLFGILILSFALWGTTDFFGQGAVQTVVAEVGNKEISAQTIERQYRRQIDTLRRRGIDEEQARMFGVLENIVERTVTAAVYDSAAENLGLAVGTAAIERDIRKRFGQVGTVQFDQLLRENGYTLQEYEAARRVEIPRMQLLESVAAGVAESEKLVANLYRWRSEQRIADAFKIAAADAKIPEPNDSELAKYHRENKARFTAPEYRAVSFVHIDAGAVAKSIKLDDAALKKIYQERLSEFSEPETRSVLQILTNTSEDAEKAHKQLQEGRDFREVAKEIAKQDEKITTLGTVSRRDLPGDLAHHVFKLAKGKFSAPIKDGFGHRIVMVTSITPETVQPFNKVKDKIGDEIRREQAIEDVVRLSNLLEDSLGKGETLESAAAGLGLEARKIKAMDLGGSDEVEKSIKDLPGEPFNATVFATDEGQVSFLTETRDGGFFVLRVEGITKPTLKPLEKVKKQVRTAWIARKRQGIARDQAKKLAQEINDGRNIADVAKANDAELVKIGPVTRTAQDKNAPPGLISKIFSLKSRGKATFSSAGDGYMVAALTDIKSPDGLADKDATKSLKDQLKSSMVADILAQFQKAVRAENKVSVDQPALKRFFDDRNSGGYGGGYGGNR